ncbi:MAG TPA: ATP-binding protein [Planctomycetaceae bacterium]|nr:ATP-binding protein [Planctomycetaceae bacterium]
MGASSLLVVQGVELGERFELGDQQVQLGRSLSNEIRLLDTEASRTHASIQRVRDQYVITDRNSSNGTYVNGQLIRSKPLQNGDQIQIGRTMLLFTDATSDADLQALTERVRLLGKHDPADRSSIVTQVAPDADHVVQSAAQPDGAQLTNLQALYRISEESVRPSVPLDQLLQRILDLTIDAVGAARGCVLLVDGPNEIQPHAVSTRGPDPAGKMPVSRSIVDYVLKSRQGVQTTDAQHDSRFDTAQSIVQAGIREAMCVPMQGRHGLLGVIYVDITMPAEPALFAVGKPRFHEDQLRLLLAIGRQAALAVENARYQQAFVKAERLAAMGQTIATLSHHIKNILQGVRGGSYLIDMGLNDQNNELVRKGWNIVEKNQGKIYHLVMDMLTFSKERQPALIRANLNATVQDVCELMQARADECHVEFKFQPAPNIPDSTFDPDGIHRAVLNCVTNAIDAVEGADHAAVLIETGWDQSADSLWVAVTDNGAGIPEDHLGRIFNIFESTKGARGTGLGLAVSQKIVREHGGEISVQSKLGEGSRFTLSWPRGEEEHVSGKAMG